jgi:hypothetical protein
MLLLLASTHAFQMPTAKKIVVRTTTTTTTQTQTQINKLPAPSPSASSERKASLLSSSSCSSSSTPLAIVTPLPLFLLLAPSIANAFDTLDDVEVAELPPVYVPILFAIGIMIGVGVLTSSLGDVYSEEASLGLMSGAKAKKERERSRSSYFKRSD